ncbi:hypothetical protein LTR36_000869 [Oleoguttula mirabilis]|uniref:Uncharacterized protein n=1 Tax=Oleoguttula mirabilis TaxID=1507867 RepID=A0AAV9J3I8_9PEZI|nr:hypothetical protein LTR36_000869 [Oleoguttula mirabilis]
MPPIFPRGGDDATPLYLLGGKMPWQFLRDWAPFSFDAVGLVTLLGSEEVNKSIGSLQRRRFSEFFPLLAGFVVAGDYFTDGESGYALFNISSGIYTTEIKPWFTRWLSLQDDINKETTVFTFETKKRDKKFDPIGDLIAPMLSYGVVLTLLACTAVMGDWPGIANFTAILVSMGVRNILIWQRRAATNNMAVEENPTPKGNMLKMFVTRADGRMVTIYAPLSVLKTFCIENCDPPNKLLYRLARAIGWLFFGGHIIILGMSSLFTQLITVALLVLPTWYFCHNADADVGRVKKDSEVRDGVEWRIREQRPFASDLLVTQEDPIETATGWFKDRRMHAYTHVRPTKEQEMMLQHWCLLPIQGLPWLQDYRHTAKENALEQAREACVAARLASQPMNDLEKEVERWSKDLEHCNRELDSWDRTVTESDEWYKKYGIAKEALRSASTATTLAAAAINGAGASSATTAAGSTKGGTAVAAQTSIAASTAVPSPAGTSRAPSSSARSGASQPSPSPSSPTADGIAAVAAQSPLQHNKHE